MIATWMVYGTVIGALLAAAAVAAERLAESLRTARRWIWAAALGGSILLPLWVAARSPVGAPTRPSAASDHRVPAGETPVLRTLDVGGQLADMIARAGAMRGLDRFDFPLTLAWAGGAILLGLAYGAAAWHLARGRRRWREAQLHGERVLVAAATGPAVVGVLRPSIVVPEWAFALPNNEQELMIAHEGEHVRARDPMLLHTAALAVFAMPWNVAAWWMLRRLRLAVEVDCDARVLSGGRDVASYGALLLDVCARRSGSIPMAAPALLERTSSLARRILAMHPRSSRYPRASAAGSALAMALLVALACETPSPEAIAPDGRDVGPTRLYGKVSATAGAPTLDLRAAVNRYFPDVARGEGGPMILVIVQDTSGAVVMTDRAPAVGLLKERREANAGHRVMIEADTIQLRRTAPRERQAVRASAAPRMKVRSAAPAGRVAMRGAPVSPVLAALRPDEIASVEVVKHSAGKIAPNAMSVILITMKPGAHIPAGAQ